MEGWMYGGMNAWKNTCRCMKRWMHRGMDGWMDTQWNECMEEQMHEGWMHRGMDGCIEE